MYRFNWHVIIDNAPIFIRGFESTVALSLLIMLLSSFVGLLLSVARVSRVRLVPKFSAALISVLRNTPLLAKIFLVYFGLASVGLRMTAFLAAVVAITMHESSYLAEIIRGGYASVEQAQMESALGIGMSWTQGMRRIIIPQVVHHIVPPCTNIFIYTIKDTSLASVIGIAELTFAGNSVHYVTWRTFEIYITLALLYLFMVTVTVILLGVYERSVLSRYSNL